jgi:hypothetical protein
MPPTTEQVKELWKVAHLARLKMNATSETQPIQKIEYDAARYVAERDQYFCAMAILNELSTTAHQFGFGSASHAISDARDIIARAIIAQQKKEEEEEAKREAQRKRNR